MSLFQLNKEFANRFVYQCTNGATVFLNKACHWANFVPLTTTYAYV